MLDGLKIHKMTFMNYDAISNHLVVYWSKRVSYQNPRATEVSITERHVVTIAQCSKEQFLEITWRNCNFPIKSVIVLLNLPKYASLIGCLHNSYNANTRRKLKSNQTV